MTSAQIRPQPKARSQLACFAAVGSRERRVLSLFTTVKLKRVDGTGGRLLNLAVADGSGRSGLRIPAVTVRRHRAP